MNDTLKKIHAVISEFLSYHCDCSMILHDNPTNLSITLSYGKVLESYLSDKTLCGKELYNARVHLSESLRSKYTDYNWITCSAYSSNSWDEAVELLSSQLKQGLQAKINWLNDKATKETDKYQHVLNRL